MSKMLNLIPMNLLDFIQFFENLDPARFSDTAIYFANLCFTTYLKFLGIWIDTYVE